MEGVEWWRENAYTPHQLERGVIVKPKLVNLTQLAGPADPTNEGSGNAKNLKSDPPLAT
jgi:hypothetical protein